MTNRRDRENDRAVRAYKRAHPGITLDQARKAVAARAGRRHSLPAPIPGVPLPRPAERLEGYVRRVAAGAGVQLHRAMEILGLEPGTSAAERLDDLAAGLPDHTIRALVAATGMTGDQARALTAPLPTLPSLAAVRRITEVNFAAGYFRRGGAGKTSTSTSGDLAAALSLALAQRADMIDLGSPAPVQPEGADEALTDARELARRLAEVSRWPLLIDTDPPRSLTWTGAATPPHE